MGKKQGKWRLGSGSNIQSSETDQKGQRFELGTGI